MIKPLIYHPSQIPGTVDRDSLFRWHFVYLDGELEIHGKYDAADIFVSDTPFDCINDGVTNCEFYTLEKIISVEAFIWSLGEIEFRDRDYHVKHTRREGLIINPLSPDDYDYAYRCFKQKSIH